jgi:hypothetical protein
MYMHHCVLKSNWGKGDTVRNGASSRTFGTVDQGTSADGPFKDSRIY